MSQTPVKPVWSNLSRMKKFGTGKHRFTAYAYPVGVRDLSEVKQPAFDITEEFMRSQDYRGVPITLQHGDWDRAKGDFRVRPMQLGKVIDFRFDERGKLLVDFELEGTTFNQIQARLIRDGRLGDVSVAFITDPPDANGRMVQRVHHIALCEEGNQPGTHIIGGRVANVENGLFLAHADLVKESPIAMHSIDNITGGALSGGGSSAGTVSGVDKTDSGAVYAPVSCSQPALASAVPTIAAFSREFAAFQTSGTAKPHVVTSNKNISASGYIPNGSITRSSISHPFTPRAMDSSSSPAAGTGLPSTDLTGATTAAHDHGSALADPATATPESLAVLPSEADIVSQLEETTHKALQYGQENQQLKQELAALREERERLLAQRQSDVTQSIVDGLNEVYSQIPDEVLVALGDSRDTPKTLAAEIPKMPPHVAACYANSLRVMAANSRARAQEAEEARAAALSVQGEKSAVEMERARLQAAADHAARVQRMQNILRLRQQVNAFEQPTAQPAAAPAVPIPQYHAPASAAANTQTYNVPMIAANSFSSNYQRGALPMESTPSIKRTANDPSFLDSLTVPSPIGQGLSSSVAKKQLIGYAVTAELPSA